MAAVAATAARAAMGGAETVVATTAVAMTAMMTTMVATAVAVTQQRQPRSHTNGSGHRHSQQ
jgi:hypothetical protein